MAKSGLHPKGRVAHQGRKSQRLSRSSSLPLNAQAYVIVGRIPILYGKMPSAGMDIMVEGDPEMQRPYVVIEANPARNHAAGNPDGAHKLAEFLRHRRAKRIADFCGPAKKGAADVLSDHHAHQS